MSQQLRSDCIQAGDVPVALLYEDDELLVVNKPGGLVVHPAYKHPDGTLVDAIHDYMHAKGEARPYLLHRLDKDTSGVLVLAKTREANHRLVRQMEGHTLTKTYLALVCGLPVPASGRIQARLRRDPADRRRMQLDPTGQASLTGYQTLRTFAAGFALLELQPMTGRMHQLRVHCTALGMPLVGDRLYGDAARWAPLEPPRQFLHAQTLEMRHPSRNERLSLVAPLPDDLRAVLAACEALDATRMLPVLDYEALPHSSAFPSFAL